MSEVSVAYPGEDRALITIERPHTLNSLDIATLIALGEAAGYVADRPMLKVVVVRGEWSGVLVGSRSEPARRW